MGSRPHGRSWRSRQNGGMADDALAAQQAAMAEISRQLLAGMPPGAERVVLTAEVISTVTRAAYLVIYPNGQQAAYSPGRPVDDEALDALRDAMYRDDVGTWFGLQFVQLADGRTSAQFNHDHDPQLTTATANDWRLDLDVYPRSEQHVPGWLAARLLG